jgi:hypothetical protein
MLTVLILVDAYSKGPDYSVWILPEGVEGIEGDRHIDDLLPLYGIRVLERVSDEQAQQCAEDIERKFRAAGFEAKREYLCND